MALSTISSLLRAGAERANGFDEAAVQTATSGKCLQHTPSAFDGALSEFKGYEGWQVIAPSQTDDGLQAIVGNPAMMPALDGGIPANGQPVPDGAMMAKIEWTRQKNADSPYDVNVPGSLESLALMMKDSKRFAAFGGW